MGLTQLREARGKISLLPRGIHRAYAFIAGYFWLPCPLCGREMGGHEWRYVDRKSNAIRTGEPWTSKGICPVCTYEDRGTNPARPGEEPTP